MVSRLETRRFSCFLQKFRTPCRWFPVSKWKPWKLVRARSVYRPKPLSGRKPITQGRGIRWLNLCQVGIRPGSDRERSPGTAGRCSRLDLGSLPSVPPTDRAGDSRGRGAQSGERSKNRRVVGSGSKQAAGGPRGTAQESGFPSCREDSHLTT